MKESERWLTTSVTGFRPRVKHGVTFFRRNDGFSCVSPILILTFPRRKPGACDDAPCLATAAAERLPSADNDVINALTDCVRRY